MRGKIQCSSFVIMPDGREIPAESLSDEEKEQADRQLAEEISSVLSEHFTNNPE